jgi:hypothetical protein
MVHGAVREITTMWARLFSTTFGFPHKGHYPKTRALILFNKIIIYLVFPRGFFQGLFTQKYLVQCVMVYVLCFMLPFMDFHQCSCD